ncbi:MAG: glycosyltransferase family 39 protein [Lentisphaerae bacterium]|nr:glycosyltransferase family 39 protein [Lentisphaerota bacterium]
MTESEAAPLRYRRYFWILLAGVAIVRLVIAGSFGLSTDESHYALYSRHLAWGYFDHPPMVAFLAAFTTIFGDSALLFRLGPIVCWTLAVIVLRQLVVALYDDERLVFSVLLMMLVMPIQHLLSIALLPDATLNLFWCGTLFALYRATQEGRWIWWLLGGVLFGGAMLSKYHGVLLPMCVLSYLLASRSQRHWLKTTKPYVAGLLGLLVFAPNIIWNMQHDWISYAFQLKHGGGKGGFSLAKLCEGFGGQMLAASPILFIMLIIAYAKLILEGMSRESDKFVFWTSLPVFVFFCLIGSFGKILPHWPAVGWWTASIMLVSVVNRAKDEGGASGLRWRSWYIAGLVFSCVMVCAIYVAVSYPVVGILHEKARHMSVMLNNRWRCSPVISPFKSKYDVTNDLHGWKEAADRIEKIRSTMPRPDQTFIFCHRFFTTSQIALYLEPGVRATSLNRNAGQYGIWFNTEKHEGWDALFVDDNHYFQGSDRYMPLFESVDPVPELVAIRRQNCLAHSLHVYKYYGFKGRGEGE